MRTHRRLLSGLAFLALLVGTNVSVQAQGEGPLVLDNAQARYPLGLYLEYLEDPQATLTIDQVSTPELADHFIRNRAESLNFGLTASAYWIRLQVRNGTENVSAWRLAFSNARMGLIDLYIQPSSESGWMHQQAGTWLPAVVRPYAHPSFVFPLALPPSEEATIYLRLQSNMPMQPSLALWSAEAFERNNHGYFGLIGLFYGFVAIVLAYGLLMLLYVRKLAHAYFLLFATFYVLNTSASDGTLYLYLFPHVALKYAVLGAAVPTVVFMVLFIRSFLQLGSVAPWLDRILVALGVFAALTFPVYVFYPPVFNLLALVLILLPVLAILGAVLALRKGFVGARYFLIAWTVPLLNAIAKNSANLAILDTYRAFDVGQYIGALLLMGFLSVAMSDEIRQLRSKTVQAEMASRISEERFRATFEQAAVGIAHESLDGRFLRLNQKFCEILGYMPEDARTLTVRDITHPDDLHADILLLERLLGGQLSTFSREKRYCRRDGQIVWVNLTKSLVRDAEGEPDYFITVVEDISNRKRNEQALNESELRYRTLVEQAGVGIVVVLEGKIVFANSAIEEGYGYSNEELINLPFIQFVVEEERPRITEMHRRRVTNEERMARYETDVLRRDGSRATVEVHAAMITYDGRPGDLVIVRDITHRRRLEADLRRHTEHLEDLVAERTRELKHNQAMLAESQAVGHVGSWELDLTANRLTWSDEVYRIFGLEPGTAVPSYEAFLDHVHPEDRAAVDAAYSGSIREGKDWYETEHRVGRPATGEVRWVLEQCNHIRGEDGRIVRSIGMVQDITERKQSEDGLDRSRRQLTLLNRSSQMINMAGLDLDQVYVAIRAASAWLVPADLFALSLVKVDGQEIEDVYLTDRDRRLTGRSYPLQGSSIGEILANGRSVRESDFRARPDAQWLGCFPDARSGMAVLLRGSEGLLGLLSVQTPTPNAYDASDQSIMEAFAAHASITLENIHHHRQAEKSAVFEERQRLARDLHDSVTQLLYSIALMSHGWGVKASRKELPSPADGYYQLEDLSLQALKEMRLLIHQLRPPVVAEVGLLRALEARLDSVERKVEMQARVLVKGTLPNLAPIVEEEIYYIVMEALNNTLRHARATTVQISFWMENRQLHVAVEDDGRGFDVSAPSRGMGTSILHNRAAAIGAQIHRESQPGQGTKVELVIGV